MEQISGLVKGLHHITLVTSNQEVNRRFYTEILGLRRVKLTVNQDDIYHRHLFYADEKGTTGSAITFFEWPELPRGQAGLGSPHHLAYAVPSLDALPKWKLWLTSHGVSVLGPIIRGERISLYLRDPDGVTIEITTPNSEAVSSEYLKELDLPAEESISADMKLTRFDHASPVASDAELTAKFLDKFVGLKKSFLKTNSDDSDSQILGMGNEERPDFLRYLTSTKASDGTVGKGNIHHIAMAVEEDEDQLKIMRRLNDVGVSNSGIVDRFWFKSLYFRDPDGNLLEIATKKPGYTADEKMENLGLKLVLPQWLEPRRESIEKALRETDSNNSSSWPPKYPTLKAPSESLCSCLGLNHTS
ncbi:MAG: VOC family protein [Nitrososphaerales archaeon]